MRKLKVSYSLDNSKNYFSGITLKMYKKMVREIENDMIHEIIYQQTKNYPVEFVKMVERTKR